MKKENKIIIAHISLLLIAIFWGTGFVAMKEGIKSIPIFYFLGIRFLISSFIVALIFYEKLKKLTFNDIRAGFIIGIFLFLGFATQTVGLKYTTTGKIAFITSVYVVIVPLLVWLIQKKFPGLKSFISSLICMSGMYFLTLSGNLNINSGDILGLVCAFFYAAHIVAVGYYAEKKDPLVMTVIQMFCVCLLSFITAPILEVWPKVIPAPAVLSLLYTVFFCTIFAFLIQNMAQKFTSPTNASIILSAEAVFGAIAGILILGEKFTAIMICGASLILVSIIISQIQWKKA